MRPQRSKRAARRAAAAGLARRANRSLLLALALLLLTPCAAAAQSFSTKVDYAVGKEPAEVILHDFNGDSVPDLATANSFDSTVSLLLGVADGTFRPAAHYSIAGGSHTGSLSLVAADFNSDGKPDLAVSNFWRSSVSLLRGHGDGTFAAPTETSVFGNPHGIAAADFNSDGKQDLAVGNNAGVNVGVLLGNGDGTFKPEARYAAGSGPIRVTAADFNADSRADLAVSNTHDETLSVLLSRGDGTFAAAVTYPVGHFPNVSRALDLNGDGKLDLVVANQNSAFLSQRSKNSVSVLVGNGDGTFKSEVSYGVGFDPRSVASGDFNGDGKPDLATANFSGTASVLAGNGDGTFQPAASFPAGTNPSSVAVRDLNGDGRADLAVTNSTRDAPVVGVMLNQAGALGISGVVRDAAGAGLDGVTLTLGGSASGVATTGASGAYTFGGLPAGGSYTVTPSKFNTVFAPASRAFNNLSADATGDFVGSPPPPTPPPTPTPAPSPYTDFTIAGRVTDPAGAGVADVMVSVTGLRTGTQVGFTDAAGNYSFRYAPDFSLIMVPSKNGYNFTPAGGGPVSSDFISGNVVMNFTGTPTQLTLLTAPVLLTVPFTDRALAFDSVTMTREPFALANSLNFSSDKRTRLTLFAARAKLAPNESPDTLTVRAEDPQGTVYQLPVEYRGDVPGIGWMTQIVVRLPDGLANFGGNIRVSLVRGSLTSNRAAVLINPPGLGSP